MSMTQQELAQLKNLAEDIQEVRAKVKQALPTIHKFMGEMGSLVQSLKAAGLLDEGE